MGFLEGVRCLLISDSTIGGIVPFLASDEESPSLHSTMALFNQVSRTSWRSNLDAALVWTRPRSVSPSFPRLSNGEPCDPADIVAEVDMFADHLRTAASRVCEYGMPPVRWTKLASPISRGTPV